MTDLPQDDTTKLTSKSDGKKKPVSSVPSGAKEIGVGSQEVTPITEFTRQVDIEPEVEGWLEKLEKEDSKLQQSVTDDKTGQVVLDDSSAPQSNFKVVLPLTKDEVDKGLHHKVLDSVRWLAEWCIRMIKMFHEKVAYKGQK